jgi:predicted ATPase
MIKLQVSEFGPIVEGTVSLKPLTIFIGPNNSGKSYFAVLAYALFRSLPPMYALSGRLRLWRVRPLRFHPQRYLPGLDDPSLAELLDDEEILKSWQEALKQAARKSGSGTLSILFRDLPNKVKELLEKVLESSMSGFAIAFADELKRCYSSDILELTRKTSKRGFNISISQEDPPLQLNMSYADDKLRLLSSHFDVSNLSVSLRVPLETLLRRTSKERDRFVLYELAERFLVQAYGESLVDSCYLPAARSGILQSHKALASYMMSVSPLVGIEELPEIPRLPGVVADFISRLLDLEKDRRTELYGLATFLESEVTKGLIDIQAGKLEYPEIYYEPRSGKFPLHRTSSMVSELAPMVLFLKYLIDPGDFLIVEEPESHLHPESQRRLAMVVARLIRAGVKVLITTHSDDFVQQLSNFVRLSRIPEEKRVKQGYSAEDYLDSEEVGAYLFDLDEGKGGSFVKELAVNAAEGIPDEEFAKIQKALYKETVRLHRAVSR